MDRAFGPQWLVCSIPRGVASGRDESGLRPCGDQPSFASEGREDSAEGAEYINLGQRSRIRSNRKPKKGCRPVPLSLIQELQGLG